MKDDRSIQREGLFFGLFLTFNVVFGVDLTISAGVAGHEREGIGALRLEVFVNGISCWITIGVA